MPLFNVTGTMTMHGDLQVEADSHDHAVELFEEAMCHGTCEGLQILDTRRLTLDLAEVSAIDEVTFSVPAPGRT